MPICPSQNIAGVNAAIAEQEGLHAAIFGCIELRYVMQGREIEHREREQDEQAAKLLQHFLIDQRRLTSRLIIKSTSTVKARP